MLSSSILRSDAPAEQRDNYSLTSFLIGMQYAIGSQNTTRLAMTGQKPA